MYNKLLALLLEQIQWLFLALHGKHYETEDIEVDAAFELFQDLQTNLGDEDLASHCKAT